MMKRGTALLIVAAATLAGAAPGRAEEPEVYQAVEDSISTAAAAPSPRPVPDANRPEPESKPAPSAKPAAPAASTSKKATKPKVPRALLHPPQPATARKLPPLLQEVEDKYARAATLQAEFTQVNEVAAMKSKKTSSGVIMVKRPDKLRWETLRPDMNLLVSDGRKFWFYTPPFDEGEHGQVIERRSNEINSKLANALLSGRFSVARDMKIQQESPSHFLLTPKPGTAGTVSHAEIDVNPEQKLIQKVVLEHKGGNRSEITLSKIELGKAIGDEAFAFTPPPGTDKVTQ